MNAPNKPNLSSACTFAICLLLCTKQLTKLKKDSQIRYNICLEMEKDGFIENLPKF